MTKLIEYFRPNPSKVPSESTVEQLSNHQLLMILGAYSAWFYVPTRREEPRLGYDASLQDHKLLVVQYKAFHPWQIPETGSFKLEQKQHNKLMQIYPRRNKPYVFYAVCIVRNYRDLGAYFLNGCGNVFGQRVLFIDAHAIPRKATSVSLQGQDSISYRGANGNVSIKSVPRNLLSVAGDFLSCNVGLLMRDIEENATDNQMDKTSLPHVNVLLAKVPSAIP